MVLVRGDIVDVLAEDDECLVLLQDRCLRLTAVAAAVVELLDRPRTSVDLQTHLEVKFGRAPVGRFDEIVTDLLRQGALHARDQVLSGDP